MDMGYPNNSRHMDALLLLPLKVKEVNGERVIKSTSCISSKLMNELTDMGYIDFSSGGGNYIITDKGKQILNQIKQAPWESGYMYTVRPI
jgi:ribosomal protein S19E (S16A)